ncbi:glycoside hydrolase family 15 protein [Aquimarina sp. ERC-38]|uniref:glycoside hydrolase family 15 protein n=1 Tax=Aquimarina sp. ERC-38 TaxID=2949996 RepID=UPI002245C876|nr:glycoside hydrolase family 15 protein [Aquimarina sp. ERC-38]UZO80093.1 glycoside hydrolase family 15 protein [Aquimarina sp. ERC-38]
MKNTSSYYAIEDYGIIGNCKTTALIHKTGSIDFFCFPNFDSPTLFSRLLDHKKGGFFHTQPQIENATIHQTYIQNTNVLLTRYISKEQLVDIIDFMPFDGKTSGTNEIIRVIKGIEGNTNIQLEIEPTFNYNRDTVQKEVIADNRLKLFCDNKDIAPMEIQSSLSFLKGKSEISNFTIEKGEAVIFVIKQFDEDTADAKEAIVSKSREKLRTTVTYWQNWMKTSTYKGDWTPYVNRSALLLKLLTSAEHGSPVAAPTFSLPEVLGGDKNWDYRYTWIRDASFTMYAFIRLGFLSEASQFMMWIQARLEKDLLELNKDIQIMYCVNGSRDLTEVELEHYEGYEKSKPVLIGNAAVNQLQLDIYGELLDTIYLFDKYGEEISYSFWSLIVKLVDTVIENWEKPDHGIWEVRESQRHYLYTKVMCWVAVDRAIRLGKKRSFPFPEVEWIKVRDQIFTYVYEEFWNESCNSFVHFKEASTLDLSILIMPLVRMISPYDKKWVATMEAIEDKIMHDVLIYRNLNDTNPFEDDLNEGAFIIGSFWFVECLSRAGQLEKAEYYFQKLLTYSNHLDLFAEEIDKDGKFLGNFPQAFSHLGLISTAFSLNRNLKEESFNVTTEYDLF